MKKQLSAEHKLDALLGSSTVNAPENFSDQVVARISTQAQSKSTAEAAELIVPRTPTTPLWQWLTLGTAGVAGIFQVISFVFGIWAATTAG